jgi:hypothetical protein
MGAALKGSSCLTYQELNADYERSTTLSSLSQTLVVVVVLTSAYRFAGSHSLSGVTLSPSIMLILNFSSCFVVLWLM